jgi:hypothetical protein
MARHWTEPFNWTQHRDRMDGLALPPRLPSFVPRLVYFVSVCSFTFEFHSLDQLRVCLEFYSRKLHPSTRREIGAADHWECERWFERLPLYLREEPKRIQVVAALQHALDEFSTQSDVA